MPRSIFVNLPVRDLKRSEKFFSLLGFTLNEEFSDDTASCMAVSNKIFILLLTYERFKELSSRPVSVNLSGSEVLNTISVESREKVDQLVMTAVKAGASEIGSILDSGFMYSRGFSDPDGHLWEMIWIDEDNVEM